MDKRNIREYKKYFLNMLKLNDIFSLYLSAELSKIAHYPEMTYQGVCFFPG